MAKFKVGDRARGTANEDGKGRGCAGVIVNLSSDNFATVKFDAPFEGWGDDDRCWGIATSKLELAPKFAVGDRVRVVRRGDEKGGSCHAAAVGEEFTVIEIYDTGETEIHTAFWYFYPHEIELVAVAQQPQLTIQAGRYYKTRDGRKVGPMEATTDGFTTKERIDGVKRLWQGDGAHGATYVANDARLDLIAQWVDEPAVAEPKFKVGDRVIATDELPSGCEGEVVKVDGTAPEYLIAFEGWLDGHGRDDNEWWMYGSQLRLVAPATSGKFKVGDRVRILRHENNHGDQIKKDLPIGSVHTINKITDQIPGVQCCILSGSERYFYTPKDLELVSGKPAIVALIENGQPRPSTYPFVHPDREAATKEARRLAGKHKGQEFGVYELVDTAKEAKVYEHEWQRLAVSGQKIAAIKEVRSATGFTLKGAKDAVEHWLAVEAA